jgi:hypothetical protein
VIEAVMVGRFSGIGITFASRGSVVRADGATGAGPSR